MRPAHHTLKAAYRRMLGQVHGNDIGESRQRLHALRKNVGAGDYPLESTMRQHLKMAGWKCIIDELWVQK